MAMRIRVSKDKFISEDAPCFIIAEAGINHNGNVALAKKMVDMAKEAGADAIKFQTFKASEFISDPHVKYTYYSQGKKIVESMLDMFTRYEFSRARWKEIINYCKTSEILFFTTPQNPSDLDFVLHLTNLPLIKVGSDDLTNIQLLERYASKNIPIIISAGMAYASEIEDAINAIRHAGNEEIVVLHCVSSYPADPSELNLRKMDAIKRCFGVLVGFSDHSIGTSAAAAAVAMGANVIEKHLTLDKNSPGPDHWFSADPSEFSEMVKAVRFVERALGSSVLTPTEEEANMRTTCRRSIVAKRPLKKGSRIKRTDIAYKRPGTGIAPKFTDYIAGRTLKVDIENDELILLDKLD
jgi:N,N'-diacetyllegionaminate synthase